MSGAVCSNDITPRIFSSINADFPAIEQYEIPAFLADKTAINNETGEATFTPALTAKDAVYAIWIGTNDLGADTFLNDAEVPGTTLVNFTDCTLQAVDQLYASGARYIIVMSVPPVNLAPMYQTAAEGGRLPNQYWKDPPLPLNQTAIHEQMAEYIATSNNVWKYQIPYETLIAKKYPGANLAYFNVNQLVSLLKNSSADDQV